MNEINKQFKIKEWYVENRGILKFLSLCFFREESDDQSTSSDGENRREILEPRWDEMTMEFCRKQL